MAEQRRKMFRRKRSPRWKGLAAYGDARSKRSGKAALSRARLVRSGLGVFGAAVGLAAALACWAARRAIWSRSGDLRGETMAAFAACGGAAVVSAALIASNSAAIGVKPIPATAAIVSYAASPHHTVAPPTQSKSAQPEPAQSSQAIQAGASEDASKILALPKGAYATPPIPQPKPKLKSGRLASSGKASGTPRRRDKANAATGALRATLAPSRVVRITVAAPTARILDRARRLDPDLRKIAVTAETPAPLPRPKPETDQSSTPEGQPVDRGENKSSVMAESPALESPAPSGPITSTLTPAIHPRVRVRIAIADNPADNAPTKQGAQEDVEPRFAAGARTLVNIAPTVGPGADSPGPEPGPEHDNEPGSEPSGAATAGGTESSPIAPGRSPDSSPPERLTKIAETLKKIEVRIEETLRQTRVTVEQQAEATPNSGASKTARPKTTASEPVWTAVDAKQDARKAKVAKAQAHPSFYADPFAAFPEPSQNPESRSRFGLNKATGEPGPVAAKQARPSQRRTRPILQTPAPMPPVEKSAAAIPLPTGKPRRQPPSFRPRAQTASLPPVNAPSPPPMPPGVLPPWMLNAAPFNAPANRPLIAIVIDDLGLDRKRSDLAVSLPGPLTMSYLTYAPDLKAQAANARRRGHELMLHLPMEPERRTAQPGPHALKIAQDEETIRNNTAWGLDRFEGYVAVNNHMGSKLTASSRHMRAFLSEIEKRGLFFLDSMTSHKSVGMRTAHEIGVPAIARDIFLDHDPNLAAIENQLTLLELKALRRGFAVAIGHPFDTTLEALRKWLPKVKAKGFAIAPISAVMLRSLRLRRPILAKRGA